MNKTEIFSVLEIQETKDKDAIRSAYMTKLSVTNPEDDPEGFKRLREAYDQAIVFAEKDEDNSPVGLWLREVARVYEDFGARLDKWSWEELFDDEVCLDAGTYEDAREALLVFFMDNTYLPAFVFDMLLDRFKIEEDYEELAEKFPEGYLDFLLRKGNGIKMEYVKAERGADADEVCRLWFDYRSAVAEKNEQKREELIKKYESIPARTPYMDVDCAAYYAHNGSTDKAERLLGELEELIGVDGYITSAYAGVCMELKKYGKAAEVSDIAEEKFPANINAKLIRSDLLEINGDYTAAKKLLEDLYSDTNNPSAIERLQNVNKKLMEQLKGSDKPADKLELGWCYYQNELNDELMELMDSFKPEEGMDIDRGMYYNLRSRALLNAQRYEEANECIGMWRSILDGQVTDNEKDENDRRRRIVLSAFLAARCLRIMADKSGDNAYLEKALEKASEPTVCEERQVLFELWLEKAFILKALERYEDTVKLCDEIIQSDSTCFPAYIIRQECNFEMKNAGYVLDDYRAVLDLVPELNYGLPYALAAHVFVVYNRYDSAFDVIKRAEENGAESDYLNYVKASALRYTAKSREETEASLGILNGIAAKPEEERSDLNPKRNIDLFEEICFAYMDLEDWDNAEKAIDKAIAMEPDNIERSSIKLDIYDKSGNEAARNKYIAELRRKFGKHPFIFYNQAKPLEDKNRNKAISLYKEALKLDEGYRDTNSRLRELYQRRFLDNFYSEDFNEALKYADKSIELYPYARQHLEKGILYMSAGMSEEAEAALKKAVELDDEYILALEWLGDALRVQEKHEEAVKYYEEAYKLAKGNGNCFPPKDYALGLESLREYDKAVEILLEMTELFPDERFVWSVLGRVYSKMKNFEKAYEAFMHYRTAYELTQNQLTNNDVDLLEVCLRMDDKKQEIFSLLSSTLTKYPKDAKAYINMAMYYCFFVGDKKLMYKFADKALDIAKAVNNDNGSLLRECYRKRMEYAYVLKDYGKIKRMKAWHAPSFDKKQPYKDKRYKKADLYILAMYLYYIGEKSEAFKMFSDMREGCNCSMCHYNICVESLVGQALIFEDKGEYSRALACLERVLEEDFDPFLINKFIERIKEKM